MKAAKKTLQTLSAIGLALVIVAQPVDSPDSGVEDRPGSYIVQAARSKQASSLTRKAGGEPQRSLPIINGVEALLSEAEVDALRSAHAGVHITANGRSIEVAARPVKSSFTDTTDSFSTDTKIADSTATTGDALAPTIVGADELTPPVSMVAASPSP